MKNIRIVWNDAVHTGTVTANNARFFPETAQSGKVWELRFEEAALDIGGVPTLVNVCCDLHPFSFLLRDVCAEYPIYVPEYAVIVTEGDDRRDFEEIVQAIRARGGKTKLQQIEEKEEYSFDKAITETKELQAPAWLGVARDMRIFEVGLRGKSCGRDNQQFDYIRPMRFSLPATPKELRENDPSYCFMAGRGLGCRHQVTKWLEEGYMPILNARNVDEDIVYDMQFLAAPEYRAFTRENVRGTDMYAADMHGQGYMFTEKQKAHADAIIEEELHPDEETVLFLRITARNTGKMPAFSYIKLPDAIPWREHVWAVKDIADMRYDGENGFSYYPETDRVCCVSTVGGRPCPQEEMVVLLKPEEEITYEIRLPHQPISRERAKALAGVRYEDRLKEAKIFWKRELEQAATVCVPEKRINEMIRAGLLHVDIGYFGRNPDGPVVPIVGVYTAIGSESSPGIQFLDCMGMSDLSTRALRYFLEKQHEDGFIQNFGGYMLETGSTLWTMGEHFRMTRDKAFVQSAKDNIVKACDYLLNWRENNKQDRFRDGKGYGMIDGKTSDPEDPFHSFMLNAGAYAGLQRSAEMLGECGYTQEAERYATEAEALKNDILETLRRNLAESELLPMGDGTWAPAPPPWAEATGPVAMLVKGGKCYSHGSYVGRDMTGTVYLILQDVIAPDDPLADIIMKLYTEHLSLNNVLFSQPYYSAHPFVHAHRGEVKPFLMEFYCGMSSLADRQSYTFWEHYYQQSPHKLHEETWFLMRCRWMLALERYEEKRLTLLSTAPRAWLEDGKSIAVDGMKTYYGTLSYRVTSAVESGKMTAEISLDSTGYPAPSEVIVRLPHPQEKKAVSVSQGVYDAETESVILRNFNGKARLELHF